jgi:xanthine dehydrogenase YagT iron-sulfur-binding subunit
MGKDQKPNHGQGVTRREFMTNVGVGAVAVAASGTLIAKDAEATTVFKPEDMVTIDLRINQHQHRLLVEPRWSLLFVIREKLGLTATKNGCERGECGSCTVLVNDVPRYACMMLAVEAQDLSITTLEGLMRGEALGPVQKAFLDQDAYQCGYCTSGQIMAAEGLLRKNPNPSSEEIQTGVSGNLCRCGAYTHIFKAVAQAAKAR